MLRVIGIYHQQPDISELPTIRELPRGGSNRNGVSASGCLSSGRFFCRPTISESRLKRKNQVGRAVCAG